MGYTPVFTELGELSRGELRTIIRMKLDGEAFLHHHSFHCPNNMRRGNTKLPRMRKDLPSRVFVHDDEKILTLGTGILQTPFCMRGLTIQNRVFYEWKQKKKSWLGTFP